VINFFLDEAESNVLTVMCDDGVARMDAILAQSSPLAYPSAEMAEQHRQAINETRKWIVSIQTKLKEARRGDLSPSES
jgi:hypothetical protein